MADKIYINKMAFYGYHGVFPEENRLGQRFFVDVVLECDLREAGQTDDLKKTINYAEIYEAVKGIVEGKPYKLVESVAEKIAETLLVTFPLLVRCHVKVTKPDPPINGYYDSVAVEITRGRQDV
ncbi:dihydroneopterin aldolase [Tuberibacillus calidus]|jgi:dihydroneopterin aldolase|uniref:dihydroneopterin aldolase n=1 Tax=Tuberibacillus calidus TaxID=340097 RepID=UPI00041BFFE7|nr:dihydroneopterin aldolase [Tuberibacillus calidus]